MWTVAVLLLSLASLFYFYVSHLQSYWKSRGCPAPTPTFFVGNVWQAITGEKHVGQVVTEIYNKFKDAKYVGFYEFVRPAMIIRDPELVRDIMIKDFDHFEANDKTLDDSVDDILGKHPIVLHGRMWKVIRAQLTPNFTAGKVKTMFPIMGEVANKMVNYLNMKVNEDKAKCINAKDIALKFSVENVCDCAFGLKGGAFENEDCDFINMAEDFIKSNYFTRSKVLIFMLPKLAKLLKAKFLSEFATNYFKSTVMQTIQYREENGVVRNDFLDAMKKQKEKCTYFDFKDSDVVGQVAVFFADSIETSSTAMGYIFYELATHPEMQDKLVEEIRSTLRRHDEKLSYDAIQEMTYLDCVFNESLRKSSLDMFYLRRCTRDYKLPPAREGDPEVILEAGMPVFIPVDALTHDEEYFPEPETFNPDRFSEENKDSIVKGTFLPFGEGPRLCLGMRFGATQVKLSVIEVVRNFVIKLNSKTMTPVQIDPKWVFRNPLGHIWIHLEKRDP